MTIDGETLMTYADGELDPLAAKRVERAIAADPALADEVAAHRGLRARLAAGYAPVAAEPVPGRFAQLLRPGPVVPMAAPRPARRWWPVVTAMAASLAVGMLIGPALRSPGPVAHRPGGLVASGALAQALDTQLSATQGSAPVRIVVTFRAVDGALCRAFAAADLSGVACRDAQGWSLRRTAAAAAAPAAATDYRQAGSPDPATLAAAQDMMAGEPLDAAGEAAARASDWR